MKACATAESQQGLRMLGGVSFPLLNIYKSVHEVRAHRLSPITTGFPYYNWCRHFGPKYPTVRRGVGGRPLKAPTVYTG